jgi:hypothetical protein
MPLPFFLHGQHNSDTLSCLALLPCSWQAHCTLNSSETGEGTCYTCQTASKEERWWIGIQGCTLPLQGNILVHERTSNHYTQSKVEDPISVLASISQPPKRTMKHPTRHSTHSMIRDAEADYPQHLSRQRFTFCCLSWSESCALCTCELLLRGHLMIQKLVSGIISPTQFVTRRVKA